MTKKIYWTLPAPIPISLPVFSVISCSSQTSETGTTEASQWFFLNFKRELVREASQTPLSNTNAVQLLKDSLSQKFSWSPSFKTGLKKFDVKVEENFFVFNYELEVPTDSMWDITVQNSSQLPPERETLKGTIKAAGLKN